MITLDQGGRGRPFLELIGPVPGLAGVVEHVSLVHSGRSPVPGSWRVVPDASPHLIFHRYRDGRSRSVVVGARSRYIDVLQHERAFTVAVRLHPGVLPLLVGGSAWDLRDRSVRLDDALGPRGVGATRRLEDARGPRDACTILVALLHDSHGAEVDWRVRGLTTANGGPGVRVRDVARTLGVGERTLRDATRSLVGLRPKEVSRIVRLHKATALGLDGLGDAEAAHRAGYTDQSHYIRECRRLLDETPGAFRSRGETGADKYKTGEADPDSFDG